jgi:hypothetical protein
LRAGSHGGSTLDKDEEKATTTVFAMKPRMSTKSGDDARSALSHLTGLILNLECADVIEALRQLLEIFRAEPYSHGSGHSWRIPYGIPE